eukprot:scaffold201463_cov44-Attheya_sp.AAC.1
MAEGGRGLSSAGSPQGIGKTTHQSHPPSPIGGKQIARKPLTLMTAVFGECFCYGSRCPIPEETVSSKPHGSQFVALDGIECLALGAMTDEQTPKQRVIETVRQLSTQPERLISVGYLMEGAELAPTTNGSPISANTSTHRNMEALAKYDRITMSIPLEVWSNSYPNERDLRRDVRKTIDHIKGKEFDLALQEFDSRRKEQIGLPNQGENRYLAGVTVHNMAVVNALAGRDDAALPLFQEAAKLKRRAFGEEHPEVAVSLDEIGIQLFAQEKFEEALTVFNEARIIRTKTLGANHPKVAMVMNNIACCNFQMGDSLAALETFKEARDIQQQSLAMGSSAKANLDLLHVATTSCNYGYMHLRLKHYDEAQTIFEENLLVQQSVLGDHHKTIKDTLSNLEIASAFHS